MGGCERMGMMERNRKEGRTERRLKGKIEREGERTIEGEEGVRGRREGTNE